MGLVLVAFVLLHLGTRALLATAVLGVSGPVATALARDVGRAPGVTAVLVLAFAVGFVVG